MGIKRITKQTKHIIDFFDQGNNAVSVVDLVSRLGEKINKATIYRILARLEQEGIVHSFSGKNGLLWYAKCISCNRDSHFDIHPHFQCNNCGSVSCLTMEYANPSLNGYVVDYVNVLIVGQCLNCS